MSAALIEALAISLVKYGPEYVNKLIALFKQAEPTVADVEALFANVKPYEAYGIPDVVPTPATPSVPPA